MRSQIIRLANEILKLASSEFYYATYFDPDKNSDKFYLIGWVGSEVFRNWGRRGTEGQFRSDDFDSPEKAEDFVMEQFASKIKKDYEDEEVPRDVMENVKEYFGI